jgi:hypothetical protein
MDPWLSPQSGIGVSLYPISLSKVRNHDACREQSLRAIYSASVDDNAIPFWACEVHDMAPSANL